MSPMVIPEPKDSAAMLEARSLVADNPEYARELAAAIHVELVRSKTTEKLDIAEDALEHSAILGDSYTAAQLQSMSRAAYRHDRAPLGRRILKAKRDAYGR